MSPWTSYFATRLASSQDAMHNVPRLLFPEFGYAIIHPCA